MATRKYVLGSVSSLVKNFSVAAAEFGALRQKVGWNFWYCRRLRSANVTAAWISVVSALRTSKGRHRRRRLAQVRHVGPRGEVLLVVAAGEAQAGVAQGVIIDRL